MLKKAMKECQKQETAVRHDSLLNPQFLALSVDRDCDCARARIQQFNDIENHPLPYSPPSSPGQYMPSLDLLGLARFFFAL